MVGDITYIPTWEGWMFLTTVIDCSIQLVDMPSNDVARYIELRHNSRHLHSALGYKTPREVQAEYLNRQLAV
jgi:transposase InsO family protein